MAAARPCDARPQLLFVFNLLEKTMWKIAVGFVIFAALAMFVIIKGGDGLDMSGEKHDTSTPHSEPAKK
jgi:hypothetical protein